jgi:hypothetical protein
MFMLSHNIGGRMAWMIQRFSEHGRDWVLHQGRGRLYKQQSSKFVTAAKSSVKDWIWKDYMHLNLIHVQYWDNFEKPYVSLDSLTPENRWHWHQFESICCTKGKSQQQRTFIETTMKNIHKIFNENILFWLVWSFCKWVWQTLVFGTWFGLSQIPVFSVH